MNVSDFRANLKDCFDRAANGEVIEVERGGLIFSLRKKSPGATPHIIIDEATDMTQEQVNALANMKVDIPKAVIVSTNPNTTNEFATAIEAGKPIKMKDPVVWTEKPCCTKVKPCQHWQWNGDSSVWVNSLSGRERGAE